MRTIATCFLCGVLTLLMAQAQAGAEVINDYYGIDVGKGPGESRPSSDAARDQFAAAAGARGNLTWVDLESAKSGYFYPNLRVAPDLTLTASDAFVGRIADSYDFGSGFNTTAEGHKFLRVSPTDNLTTVAFVFDQPIQAWGAYFTEVSTSGGELTARYDDGTPVTRPIDGNYQNGVLFWGFVLDPGKSISRLELQMNAGAGDVYGVDDVGFVAVPEPSAFAALLAGAIGLLAIARQVRKPLV